MANNTLHEFYPDLVSVDNKHQKYQNGEWDMNKWKLLTQIMSNMHSSFGYKSPSMTAYLSQHEPHPNKVKKWSKFVGIPILAKDVGNPSRPTD